MIRHAFFILMGLAFFALFGCVQPYYEVPQLTPDELGRPQTSGDEASNGRAVDPDLWKNVAPGTKPTYSIQLGDVLDIKFFGHSELDETTRVRPDGKISLQLIGDIEAAGLTPLKLADHLNEKYLKWFYELNILVNVRDFAGYKVYVGGEVKAPGVVTTFGNVAALEAIFMTGGFKDTAFPDSVIIIRKGPDSQPYVRKIDLAAAMSGKAPEFNILLRPFDVLYVPKSAVAQANLFVEQYITRMLPGTLHAGFSYVISDPKTDPKTNINLFPPP